MHPDQPVPGFLTLPGNHAGSLIQDLHLQLMLSVTENNLGPR
jgi:hypothetical protein